MEKESEHSNQSHDGLINVIICGAPGSGKGTQSDLIIRKYNLMHLSSGELLRNEIAEGTELGKEAEEVISNGQLVRDDLIIKLIAKQINKLDTEKYRGIILDGFPRTLEQAEALEEIFNKNGTCTDVMICLQVDEDELISRLLNRGKTSGRSDDNLEIIKNRLVIFENQTRPIAEFYQKLGKHTDIYGIGTIDEIFQKISNVIDKAIK